MFIYLTHAPMHTPSVGEVHTKETMYNPFPTLSYSYSHIQLQSDQGRVLLLVTVRTRLLVYWYCLASHQSLGFLPRTFQRSKQRTAGRRRQPGHRYDFA